MEESEASPVAFISCKDEKNLRHGSVESKF